MIYLSLLNNITLLVSLSVVHTILLRYIRQESKSYATLSGLLFGAVTVIGMFNSVELMPGILFDGRSVILVTAGVFGGPVPALIAMIIGSAFRLFLGGDGTLMGILVIIESGCLGILYYYLRKRFPWAKSFLSYFILAFVVHVIMLALTIALPGEVAAEVLVTLLLPVLIIYPLATLLLFLLFQSQERYMGLVERLSESEAALREANKIAGLGRWMHDHSSDKLEWSDTIFDIFEINKEKFGASYGAFLEIVHPDDREMVDHEYRNCLIHKEPYEVEHRLLMKDGRIKWVIERCWTDYNQQGKAYRSVGIVQEITERKLAGIALEESKQMLRKIIDTIPVRVFWKDIECRYIGCNQHFANDAGFGKPEELVGLDDYSMGWVEQADMYRSDDMEVMKSGIAKLNYEEPQTTPEGKEIWLKTSKLPLTNLNGKVIGVLGVYEDITERKEMEEELILAKEKAEESDRLKTAFLNNLSHEIRTPLNAIVGFSELLKKPDISASEVKHYTEIIDHSSGQLLAIIDDIFDIAALEAEQVKIINRSTDLNQMFELIYEQFAIRAAHKGIDLVYEQSLPDEEAVFITDETKLSQILNNIIGNALKFTKKGRIVFGSRKLNKHIEFFVRDTGMGIPEELHEKIFERFRQGDLVSTGEFGGSGLGLFIAKSYVELLGGKIWLKSQPGKGSEFCFTIPLKRVSEKQKVQTKEPVVPVTKTKTVLIAEDSYVNFLLLKEYLSRYNADILHADNGSKAVELCKGNPEIDLVLMDVKMPVMDGFTATGLIREMRPDLPVIALTAYAQTGDRDKALQNGCNDYISKPVERKSFLLLVNKYLFVER